MLFAAARGHESGDPVGHVVVAFDRSHNCLIGMPRRCARILPAAIRWGLR